VQGFERLFYFMEFCRQGMAPMARFLGPKPKRELQRGLREPEGHGLLWRTHGQA
jgi:hypothetical protein